MQIGCLQKMRRKKKRESIGGGIGSISNILDASQMTLKISVSLLLHLSFLVANFILVCILTPAFIFSLKILFVFENISLYTLVTGKWLEFFSNAIRSNC